MLAGLLLSALLAYRSPVNYEIALAGNFCEPRLNHYHGGVDIKTGGVEGKAILAIAGGYVSRVVVGLYGYGCAVYVHHPDGRTSMYCHLKKLHPNIAAALEKRRYRLQESNVDVRLQPGECPVAAGQMIAVSGNTGASRAPHLHMEVYDRSGGNAIDPLDLLAPYIKDTTPPMAHAFMAYPMEGEGVFCGSRTKRSFRVGSGGARFTAWGKVGFGVWANDYMDNTYNKYGVRETVLSVDGKTVFRADMATLSPADNRWMDFQGDYDFYRRCGVWYMRAYAERGVNISALQFDENRGVVDFREERDYNITFAVSDFAGNTREYKFTVTGKKTPLPSKKRRMNTLRTARRDAMSVLSYGGATLTIKPQSLPYDMELTPMVKPCGNAVSCQYCFCGKPMPLARWAKISFRCGEEAEKAGKLYIKNTTTSAYCKSYCKDGVITGFIRDIGQAYAVARDDAPPVVSPIARQSWEARDVVRVSVFDRGSGLKSCRAYIDGSFILLRNIPKTAWLSCDLRKTPVERKGKERTLKVVATDNVGNTSEYTTHIIY